MFDSICKPLIPFTFCIVFLTILLIQNSCEHENRVSPISKPIEVIQHKYKLIKRNQMRSTHHSVGDPIFGDSIVQYCNQRRFGYSRSRVVRIMCFSLYPD